MTTQPPAPPRIAALLMAAGRGARFGGATPKQYLSLSGRPVVRWAADALLAHPRIERVVPVIDPGEEAALRAATRGLALDVPVAGGETRQQSVRLGLAALSDDPPDWVLVHDAARPLLPHRVIDDLLTALETAEAAVPVLPSADTLKEVDASGAVVTTVDRRLLRRVQTPQAFRFATLLAAHEARGEEATDDAALVERMGLPVATVPGDPLLGKITTAEDLTVLEALAGGRGEAVRTGIGFDVHRFGPGDHVMLCGVAVPHSHGLVGHSDADVGLHAITDALLGAVADGDIGQHFPPGDPRWRGAPSHVFLAEASRRIAARGGRVLHVDVTILAEKPRVGPHRAEMVATVAGLLGLAVECASVKATTTEGLGFVGRREGIAAMATATVLVDNERQNR